MIDQAEVEGPDATTTLTDPRALLARWANGNDEWVRLLVSDMIATSRQVGDATSRRPTSLLARRRCSSRA